MRITLFKGTSSDWVRFENMFVTQVHSRPVPDEEKFGYLLEMVVPKVREKISNLKPGTLGYKTAWERLQKEYGQTKLVVNAHMDEIINLTPVKGSSFEKVREFYEVLSKNYDALQTLGEADMLRGILSHLASIYDPLGMISPTTVKGKQIYRDACDETKGWNADVSDQLKRDWIKWSSQLKPVRIPRSVTRGVGRIQAVHLHVFADASNIACSAVTIAVVEGETGVVKGLLTSKSRVSKRNTSIARLELVSGQMAANMVRNLHKALKRWPIVSTTVWMDSMVALYWIRNPGKPWKVFVSNRVKKMAEITGETGISWKYCPTEKNLADLGSRGAGIHKMETGGWFTGPEWLLDEKQWPDQPDFECTKDVNDEHKPIKEENLYTKEHKPDEWEALLERHKYWKTLRVTAWALRFLKNSLARRQRATKLTGPLTPEEIRNAKKRWIKKVQSSTSPNLRTPGWELVKDDTSILRCSGRISGYNPIYIEGGLFGEKLIAHTHEQIMHLGVANTMANIKDEWWIPRLRSKVKKVINRCNTCKVFSTKPYGSTTTAAMPRFRAEEGRPFETTGVDFAGPLDYKVTKKERGKCYVLIFTCATSRAVHLEVTKSQTAEEFQRKLNSFIARKTRPRLIISDNASVFKATASWIKKIRKSERLQDHLAREDIRWQFNLSRSPWWGGMYERVIKDLKKTLYKTLRRTTLSFEQLETVIVDIERQMNNRPLTYVESEGGEEQVLTPNVLMWGQNAHEIEEIEEDGDEVSKLHKRLKEAKQHAWKRWKHEYIRSLLESHRVNRKTALVPDIGEIVLVVGDEKNRAKWKKGRVMRHVRGRDGVIRGVILLHKGHHIERPLTLVCPLEIKGPVATEDAPLQLTPGSQQTERFRIRRQAAETAKEKIRLITTDDDDD